MEHVAKLSHKSHSTPDEARSPPHAKIEIVSLPGHKFSRLTLQAGWRWSNDIKPIAKTDLCQLNHVGYVVSGTMGVSAGGKTEHVHAGESYEIPPGHDAWTEGQEAVVLIEFSQQTAEWAKQNIAK
jgi:hypothetical protein